MNKKIIIAAAMISIISYVTVTFLQTTGYVANPQQTKKEMTVNEGSAAKKEEKNRKTFDLGNVTIEQGEVIAIEIANNF